VKTPLFCAIFTSDLQRALNNEVTIIKLHIQNNKLCNDKSIINIEVGEIEKAKDLPASLHSKFYTLKE
jgi:hypothetical protein